MLAIDDSTIMGRTMPDGIMGVKELGNYLRNLRDELGLTQEELEELSNVTQHYISQLERGKYKNPGEGHLAALADALGITMRDINIARGWVVVTREEVEPDADWPYIPYRGLVPADNSRWLAIAGKDSDMRRVPPESVEGVRNPFAVQAHGDCLDELGIPDGRIIVCETYHGGPVRDGALVVVRIADEVTLKRWFSVGDYVELRDGAGNTVVRLPNGEDVHIEGIALGHFSEFERL